MSFMVSPKEFIHAVHDDGGALFSALGERIYIVPGCFTLEHKDTHHPSSRGHGHVRVESVADHGASFGFEA